MSRACDARLLPFNWRDVGASLLPENNVLPAGRVLRSGLVDLAGRHRLAIIGRPQMIVNLRPEGEMKPETRAMLSASHVRYVHCAIADAPGEHVCYNTTDPRTLRWVNDVLRGICEGMRDDGGGRESAILVHCRSGKDRTGVIVAALLLLVRPELDSSVLERDYMRSDGKLDLEAFRSAVSGLKKHRQAWAKGVDEKKMTQALLGGAAAEGQVCSSERFVSASLKLLLPLINPAGVAAELGMAVDGDCKELEVVDEGEREELCRQLLPLTESGVVACNTRGDQTALARFLIAKAACLEQLYVGRLQRGQACACSGGGLQEAAETWQTAAGSSDNGKLKKLCQEHRQNCSDAAEAA